MVGIVAAAIEAFLIPGGVSLFVRFTVLGSVFPAAAEIRIVTAGCVPVIALLMGTRAVPSQAVLAAIVHAVLVACAGRRIPAIAIMIAVPVVITVPIVVAVPVLIAVAVPVLITVTVLLR